MWWRISATPSIERDVERLEALLNVVEPNGIAANAFDRNLALVIPLRLETLRQKNLVPG
jgi:hypothetical protein